MVSLSILFAAAAVSGVTGTTPAGSGRLSQPVPRIEVAFVLDTTGSMGGLIEGAKRRIWSVARRISEGQPRPDLRIALVGYRDRGDAYVTRVHDLTGDMDAVYANLMAFHAAGGGDTPEHVSAALSDAVHRLGWSHDRSPKVVFLVGDAPPHVDYQDGFDYRRHVAEARQLGIAVETIQCGADPATAAVWQEIASAGAGHYARIDADGGMPVAVTPVDAELARLNAELVATVVAAGTAHDRSEAAGRMAARQAMAAPIAAEAASYYAGADHLAANDLVDLPVAEQKKALSKTSELPASLREKDAEASLAYLREQKARRTAVQARIREIAQERERLLRPRADGFDETVVRNLQDQARKQGVRF